MPQVLVWECPKTAKLFRSKAAYVNHLKSKGAHNLSLRNKNKRIAKYEQSLRHARATLNTFQDIAEFIVANYEDYFNLAKTEQPFNDRVGDGLHIELTGRFSPDTPNSHNRPEDGITNWCGSKEGPRGYPGITGRIVIAVYEKNSKYNHLITGSDVFRPIANGINTGSGGGGATYKGWHKCAYQLEMFMSDWPALAAAISERATFDAITHAGRDVPNPQLHGKATTPGLVYAER